jgi:hypothetical protein
VCHVPQSPEEMTAEMADMNGLSTDDLGQLSAVCPTPRDNRADVVWRALAGGVPLEGLLEELVDEIRRKAHPPGDEDTVRVRAEGYDIAVRFEPVTAEGRRVPSLVSNITEVLGHCSPRMRARVDALENFILALAAEGVDVGGLGFGRALSRTLEHLIEG